MEPLVIKISGSLVYPPITSYLVQLVDVVKSLRDYGYKPVLVTGGGSLARETIGVLRNAGKNQALQDLMGITASRLNAFLLASLLYPHSSLRVPTNVEGVLEIYSRGLIPVVGGFEPGQSTNAVALLVAEAIGGELVVDMLKDAEGVYDREPTKPGARLIDRMKLADLEKIVENYKQEAGKYTLMDHLAIQIARRSKIKIYFINGRDPWNLVRLVRGEKIGTLVEPN